MKKPKTPQIFQSVFKQKNLPAVKLLFFFIFFYLFFIFLNFKTNIVLGISIFSLISAICLFYYNIRFLSYLLFIITLSSVTFLRYKQDNFIDDLAYVNNQKVFLKGEVKKIIYENERFARFVAECEISSKSINVKNTNVIVNLIKHSKGKLRYVSPRVSQNFISIGSLSTFKNKIFNNEFPTKLYSSSMDANFQVLVFHQQFSTISQQSYYYEYLDRITNSIENQILYLFPKDVAKLILAVSIGKKNLLTTDDKEKFSLTGTSHIIAVSGLHVAVIVAFLYFITMGIKNQSLKTNLNVVLIIIYVVLTGLQDSAIRAAIMFILILYAIELKRAYDIKNILCVAVIFFILFQPSVVFSISFQLSVLALIGLVFFYERIESRINGFFPYTKNLLAISIITTISATFLLNPVVAYYFHNFSLSSLFANIYAIPLISMILIISIPIICLSYFIPSIALYLGKSIVILVRLLNSLNDFVLQFDSLYFKDENSILIALGFMFLVLLLIYAKSIKQTLVYIIPISIILLYIKINLENSTFKKVNNFEYEYSLFENDNVNYLIMYDFDKNVRPALDYALYKYLQNDKMSLKLYFNGNNGQLIYDKLRNEIKIDTFRINENLIK